MNIWVQIFAWTCFYLRSERPSAHGNYMLNFMRNARTALQTAHFGPRGAPPAVFEDSSRSCTLSAFGIVGHSYFCHFSATVQQWRYLTAALVCISLISSIFFSVKWISCVYILRRGEGSFNKDGTSGEKWPLASTSNIHKINLRFSKDSNTKAKAKCV